MTHEHIVHLSELRVRFLDPVGHDDIVDCCVELAADPRAIESTHAVIDFSEGNCCSCSCFDIALLTAVSRDLVGRGGAADPVDVIVRCGETCPSFAGLEARGQIRLSHAAA
jgi:hypothetical protein